jgi:hypothetical protein
MHGRCQEATVGQGICSIGGQGSDRPCLYEAAGRCATHDPTVMLTAIRIHDLRTTDDNTLLRLHDTARETKKNGPTLAMRQRTEIALVRIGAELFRRGIKVARKQLLGRWRV